MATNTTNELLTYYARLLIKKFRSKPKAIETVKAVAGGILMPQTTIEVISFSEVPASGSFVLAYGEDETAAIDWDDTESDIQTKIRAITGLEEILVDGSPAEGSFEVRFEGVTPPAKMLVLVSTTLENGGSDPISITITETDEILPLAVQNAFNLNGDNTAVGKQLDVIGKYVGVKRNGTGLDGRFIVLDDADFLKFIQLAIIQNSVGSSLADIQSLLNTFFPDQVLVFDTTLMSIYYYISTEVGSEDLIEMFITQGLLPRPMAVRIPFIIFAPNINAFFGFRTYEEPNDNATPFNTYDDYDTSTHWLSYHDVFTL